MVLAWLPKNFTGYAKVSFNCGWKPVLPERICESFEKLLGFPIL
jgi:hypothetical protein